MPETTENMYVMLSWRRCASTDMRFVTSAPFSRFRAAPPAPPPLGDDDDPLGDDPPPPSASSASAGASGSRRATRALSKTNEMAALLRRMPVR